jgi:hypothetical protein
MDVAFVDSQAVGASVVFKGVVLMCFVACWEPLN